MKEDFDLVERTMVFALGEVENFLGQREANGAEEKDGLKTVKTLLLTWDDDAKTKVRAATYPETVEPVRLKDGRLMVTGLWSRKAVLAFGTVNAVELTKAQVDPLLPAYPVPLTPVNEELVNPN